MSDKWTEAWSRLTNAFEAAYEAGMTDEEIQDTWDNARPVKDAKPHVGGGPKPKRKKS